MIMCFSYSQEVSTIKNCEINEVYLITHFIIDHTGLDAPVLKSISNRVKPLNPNYPMQGHISLSNNSDEIMQVIYLAICLGVDNNSFVS